MSCPKCGVDIIVPEGDEAFCNIDGGYIKKSYNDDRKFVVAVGGKKGLTVAQIKKENQNV
jgi:hypothetical protein